MKNFAIRRLSFWIWLPLLHFPQIQLNVQSHLLFCPAPHLPPIRVNLWEYCHKSPTFRGLQFPCPFRGEFHGTKTPNEWLRERYYFPGKKKKHCSHHHSPKLLANFL